MNDDKLIEFLTQWIAQFKELEALADGDSYQTLIERVREAWEDIDKIDR